MVPNLTKGRGIKGTALYVLHDERSESERAIGEALTPEHQTAHRVGHTETRNLSTDNPELAWRLMCATAAQREQLKQAAGVHKGGREAKYHCGHLSLSWEHQARPDGAEISRAADGALKALGWEKLQALIVEHRDHEHAHCHIVVNLVDPETGRIAPNAKGDYEKLQRWAHAYEKERGQIVCEHRAQRIEAAAREEKAPDRRPWLPRKEWEAQQAAKREARQREATANGRREALGRIKDNAATQRDRFRPEWAELYKRHRIEQRDLAQREREQAGKLKWAIDKPAARAAMLRSYQPATPATPALAPKPKGLMGVAVSPQHLAAVVDRARLLERRTLVQRQAAEKVALAAKVEAARHAAHREIFRQQPEYPAPRPVAASERSIAASPSPAPPLPSKRSSRAGSILGGLAALGLAALTAKAAKPSPARAPQPEPAPSPPARQPEPVSERGSSAAEQELARYAAQRAARAHSRGLDRSAAKPVAKPVDPPTREPEKAPPSDPAPMQVRPAASVPANANERDELARFRAVQAARVKQNRERERDRGRERDR